MTETNQPTQLQINQAMLDAGGEIALAAATVGLNEQQLKKLIASDEVLEKRWSKRPIEPPPPTHAITKPEDTGIAEAMKLEEERLSKGVALMKMTDRAQELALTCQKFYRSNFGQIHQMTSGGVVKSFFEAMEEVEKINLQLEQKDWPEEQRISYESILREDRSRLLQFIINSSQVVNNNVLIQAKVKKLVESGDGKGGGPKPAFGSQPLKKVE
jgi:hypothetical protein